MKHRNLMLRQMRQEYLARFHNIFKPLDYIHTSTIMGGCAVCGDFEKRHYGVIVAVNDDQRYGNVIAWMKCTHHYTVVDKTYIRKWSGEAKKELHAMREMVRVFISNKKHPWKAAHKRLMRQFVRAGLWALKEDHPGYAQVAEAQRRAQEEGLGLWQNIGRSREKRSLRSQPKPETE